MSSHSLLRPDERDDDAEQEENKNRRFPDSWYFVKSVDHPQHLPQSSLGEIALAGRSNVGKSSLINAVIGRRGLARVSNTPGRTQMINFFAAPQAPFMLVDLPGFGFARAPTKTIDSWSKLIYAYLSGRPNLKRVIYLVDSRHGIKPVDVRAMEQFDRRAVSYQIIFTKADKVTGSAQSQLFVETEKKLARRPAAHPEMLFTSAQKKLGIDQLREVMMFAARPDLP